MSGFPLILYFCTSVKTMKAIKISSFAKINLSIDVTGLTEERMHLVDMVMQQLSFHDDVAVRYEPVQGLASGCFEIEVKTNRRYIPTDERNLAYKAAMLMAQKFGADIPGGKIQIDIFKRIPVAAGLAGGSGNGAAVLHGLNVLWKLHLPLTELCRLGEDLGSDVPFCVMGQAKYNFNLPADIRKDRLASCCCRAVGTGTQLKPLPGIRKAVVIAKPPIGVSTKEVYGGIDDCTIDRRPDNNLLEKGLQERNPALTDENCINVLENYTLRAYPRVQALKTEMEKQKQVELALMSGSGPTVFGIFRNITAAKDACQALRECGYEAYWTKTVK